MTRSEYIEALEVESKSTGMPINIIALSDLAVKLALLDDRLKAIDEALQSTSVRIEDTASEVGSIVPNIEAMISDL